MSNSSHSSSHSSGQLGHIVPQSIYLGVLVLLLILTVVTVVVSRFDFGSWNIIVAMLIASVKAMLVALFFMHLKYENPVTWLYAIFPIILLFFLIGGLFLDNPFRADPETGKTWKETVVEKAIADRKAAGIELKHGDH